MINWRKKVIGIIAILIIGLCLLGVSGQEPEPVEEPVKEIKELETRLNVIILDGINDKLFKLENCAVLVKGKLRLVEDLFNYTKTFTEGDRYEITINIRKKT